MEVCMLIQSLDSVWFFSNVLLSSQTQPNVASFKGNTLEEEDPQKTMKPIPQSQQNESPNADFSTKFPEPQCESECGPVEKEIEIAAKKEERRRKRKRKSKRKILGKVELGFGGGDWGLNYNGIGIMCGSEQHLVKMSHLSGGMAMKEHLKSWAYAVACTVR